MDFLVWLEGSALSTWVREADTVLAGDRAAQPQGGPHDLAI